jgi:SPP1 family predicted phage head-tail adaptor
MAALNHRVTLQAKAAGFDELGQPVAGWTDVATLWADIRHLSGLQAIKADANISTVRASVRIRKRSDVDAGMRVVHGSTVYDVRAVLNVGTDMQDLVCEVSS